MSRGSGGRRARAVNLLASARRDKNSGPRAESSDTTEPTTEARNDIVVTGVVENRTSAEIPDSARVLVAWIVSSGSPDYGYIFGEGEITAAGDSFRLALPAAPPEAALNLGALGVGVIFVTTDQQITEGDSLPQLPESELSASPGGTGSSTSAMTPTT